MWWTFPSTTKQHGNSNPYLGWANRGCGHGNTKFFSGRIIYLDVSNGTSSKFHPPKYLQSKQSILWKNMGNFYGGTLKFGIICVEV
jgi:hypothetical protein